jgi:hypothetical protein
MNAISLSQPKERLPLFERFGPLRTKQYVERYDLIHSAPPSVVARWLDSMSERSRFVVERRYGLNGHSSWTGMM